MEIFVAICLVLVPFILETGYCLQCYKCENVEIKGKTSNILASLNGKTDPGCESSPENTVTCPYKCSYVEGEATFDIPVLGEYTVKVHTRDCSGMGSVPDDGCHTRSDDAKTAINGIISGLSGISNTEVDGKACFCSTSRCDANCTGQTIAGFCIVWWMWILVVVGGILALLLLTCCCCCCCTCCRSKKSRQRGAVVNVVQTTNSAPVFMK